MFSNFNTPHTTDITEINHTHKTFRKITDSEWSELYSVCPSLKSLFDVALPAAILKEQPIPTTVCIAPDLELRSCLETHINEFLGKNLYSALTRYEQIFTYKPGDLIAIITSLDERDTLIVPGEITKYNSELLSLLQCGLGKYAIDITIGKGPSANSMHLDLPHFSAIIYVNSKAELPKSLASVIKNVVDLTSIPSELVNRIKLRFLAEESGYLADKTVLTQLAHECSVRHCFPSSMLGNIIDYMILNNCGTSITLPIINEALSYVGLNSSLSNNIDSLDRMTSAEFIRFAFELFSRRGYRCEYTKQSHNQGIHVIAERDDIRVGIQAICSAESVGNAVVQQVIAGVKYYDLDKGFVITNGSFTMPAMKLAEASRIALWDRSIISSKLFELSI